MPILMDADTGNVAGQILGETDDALSFKCLFQGRTFEVAKNDPRYFVRMF